MTEKPANPLAFPQAIAEIHGVATNSDEFAMGGMTLRDYFAAQVLDFASHDLTDPSMVAARAYAIADALLAERSKP
jgi:hypothetical protein